MLSLSFNQNIGVLYDDMDKYNESLNYLYECLRIRRLKLGNDRHPYVCETLCFIASIFRKQDVGKALTLFRIVLNMKTKELSLTNDKECRELLVAYSDVLEVAKEKLNEERKNKSLHEEIATLFFKIGNIHENLHEYNDAVSYYNKSLKVSWMNMVTI
jgi:tetratricopeptide (TPR) repeat protein